jgi:SsrA-binding protein
MKIKNKKAKFEYHFIDTYTAGIQLLGTEIKSIRMGKASIAESYCVIEKGEVYVRNMYIQEYGNGGFTNHQPRRDRKLLLNKSEIIKIDRKLKTKGLALICSLMFIDEKGRAKLNIALAEGKKLHDKRHDLKEKDDKRDMDRRLKNF